MLQYTMLRISFLISQFYGMERENDGQLHFEYQISKNSQWR